MFECYYFFFCHCLLSCRYEMLQKKYSESTKMGEIQKVVRGGHGPPWPPPPIGTALPTRPIEYAEIYCEEWAETNPNDGLIKIFIY